MGDPVGGAEHFTRPALLRSRTRWGGGGLGSSQGPPSSRLRLARMAEEMREAEAPSGQPGPLTGSSPTELQYRRCIQEFISLHLDES